MSDTFGDTFGGSFGGGETSAREVDAQHLSALAATERYFDFFLTATSEVVELELLEVTIPHPATTLDPRGDSVYRVQRQAIPSVTVTHEDGTSHVYDYLPMRIEELSQQENLDTGFRITLGDLGQIIPQEFDRVARDNSWEQEVVVRSRGYRSDDLTKPMVGPLKLVVEETTSNHEGTTFEARAPSVNVTQTGTSYTVAVFPSLRGFM